MPVVNYDWDEIEDNIAEEYDDAGNTTAEYTTEPGLFGDTISQRRNGEDSYHHFDGQGSTLALTNSAGDVTDTQDYNAFGEVTARTGDTANPFQYIGQKGYYRDAETGESEVRRRPLQIERWLAPDPIGVELSNHNLYLYAANNPTLLTDPSGLKCVCNASVIAYAARAAVDVIGGGFEGKLDPSSGTNPGTVKATFATVLVCLQTTPVEIGYLCCDKAAGIASVHYQYYEQQQMFEVLVGAGGGKGEDIVIVGVDIAVPTPIPKVKIKLAHVYKIANADLNRAKQICITRASFPPLSGKVIKDNLPASLQPMACPATFNTTKPGGALLPLK